MINIKRIIGFASLAVIVGISSSFSLIDSGNTRKTNSEVTIWSKKETAYNFNSNTDSSIFTMQGAEEESDIDYNAIIPVNPKRNSDLVDSLEMNIDRLDLAMQQSSEIMRSLNTKSASCFDEEQIMLSDETQMSIDEFEMQELQSDYLNSNNTIGNNVIAGVDIMLPMSNNFGVGYNLNNSREISSATMKVVEVLLKYGLEDRALSMIENEVMSTKIN